MYRLKPTSIDTVEMTPERSSAIITACPYSLRRILRADHVAALVAAMESNTFKPSTIEIAECDESFDQYLIDGLHRLHAIVEHDSTELLIVIQWSVDTMSEIGQLYSQTDAGKARTIRDRIKPLVHDRGSAESARLGAAVIYAEQNCNYSDNDVARALRNDVSQRATRVHQYGGEYDAIKSYLEGADGAIARSILGREAVLAVYLQTQRYQPEKTAELLRAIADNDGLMKFSPAWTYVNKIATAHVGGGKSDGGTLSRQVAAIWNAHYERRNLTYLYKRDSDLPFLLCGTPWTGQAGAGSSSATSKSLRRTS